VLIGQNLDHTQLREQIEACLNLPQGERILFLKGRLDKGFRDHD
jgi:hypothetical protein